MSSTTKPAPQTSHRSIFTHIPSSRSSMHSTSSGSSTPPGCRDFRLRYAKDGKGHDLSASYPYSTPVPSSSSSATETSVPVSCRDSIRLRYAKDGKGHSFADSYPAAFGVLADDEQAALLAEMAARAESVPQGARDWNKRVNRYAKDGKGVDFAKSYKY